MQNNLQTTIQSNEIVVYNKCLALALSYHSTAEEPYRRGTNLPYSVHPLRVANLVDCFTFRKDYILKSAAILHDTLEDTDLTIQKLHEHNIPIEIINLVQEMTDEPTEIALFGKEEYQKHKLSRMTTEGLLIKLCDRLDNIMDTPTDNYCKKTITLMEHIKSQRVILKLKTTKEHLYIMKQIEQAIKLKGF